MRVEAKYYTQDGDAVICGLCPNRCRLTELKIGACHVRQMEGGKLYALSYANPCALNIDPIEKKPLYHFYPGSKTYSVGVGGCLLHCKNCQNYSISQVSPDAVQIGRYMPEDLVEACIASGCDSISYTYSEPFAFFEYMLDTAKLAKEKGLKNILVSSGFVNEEPLRDLIPYLDAANIDLKSFNPVVYKELCKGDFEVILCNLKILHENQVWLEITNLIIPGYSDDELMIREMCVWLIENGFEDTPLHFSRFFPMYKLDETQPTPIEVIERAVEIAHNVGMKYIYPGNTSLSADTHCPDCNLTLIKRFGYRTEVSEGFDGACPHCQTIIPGRF